MNPTLSEIKQLALQAGAIIRDNYEQPILIQHKGEMDLVTEIDKRSEALIINAIHNKYPDHTIMAEESGLAQRSSEHAWYIDPLDGTLNYAHGVPFFSVSIAYAYQGRLTAGVVYDPMRDELFSAELGKGATLNDRPIHVATTPSLKESLLVTGFAIVSDPDVSKKIRVDNMESFKKGMLMSQGVRRLGSAALDLVYVAAGRMDGYWEYGIHAWDIAAGALIVEEAGGKVTKLNGDPNYFVPPFPILASTPLLHADMLALLNDE